MSSTEDPRIARIEQSLIPVDPSTRASGPPQTLTERMAALNVRGVSVAVFDSGRIVWARGYGVRDAVTGSAVDTSTLFQAASISKPVTSAGMFRLVERGTLGLDEDVNDRLTAWKVPENAFTQTEKVTLRRIVSHTAGLTVRGFSGYKPGEPLPTMLQILDGVTPANSGVVRVDTFPGVLERYSGGGFIVMQQLLQEVTRQPFASLMRELVLQPAGMVHSTYSQPLPADLTQRAATAHNAEGHPIEGGHRVYPEQASAGLWTTPSDLARFMLTIGRSYRGEPGGLLQQSSARTMLTRLNRNGQGFFLTGEGDALHYYHSGVNAGFTAYALAFAETGTGIVVMTNTDERGRLMFELIRAVAREYGWKGITI